MLKVELVSVTVWPAEVVETATKQSSTPLQKRSLDGCTVCPVELPLAVLYRVARRRLAEGLNVLVDKTPGREKKGRYRG